VVFVPILGVLYLDVYEDRLLDLQERAMVQQARLLAAAIGGSPTIDVARAQDILSRLSRRNEGRLRIFDLQGTLIADSVDVAAAPTVDEAGASYAPSAVSARQRFLYRIGAALAGLRSRVASATDSWFRPRDLKDSPREADTEVAAALSGRYGAATRRTPGQRSLTLSSAVPVRDADSITGAVLVSQSTFRILQALYDVRLRIFQVVVASLVAAAVLTTVAATTIVRPLARLRRAAASLAVRQRPLPNEFPGTDRRDEIGELARALEQLTRRLSAQISRHQEFAADVSHEFKNPLAGIRSAAETIEQSGDAAERARFIALMLRDVERLERLVSSLRDLARIDGRLEHGEAAVVELGVLLRAVAGAVRLPGHPSVQIDVVAGEELRMVGDRESLVQVFENLLTNAVSFAPEGSAVKVTMERRGQWCHVSVEDRGPGIPAADLERVFDRFFTYRPFEGRREHLGLGLAIARRIVENHGGVITAANRPDGGAVFVVKLPGGEG
jgi:two-component system sensor histidine kinase ChvG